MKRIPPPEFDSDQAISHSYSWDGESYAWFVMADQIDGAYIRYVFTQDTYPVYLGYFEMKPGPYDIEDPSSNLGSYGKEIVELFKYGPYDDSLENIEAVIARLVEFCKARVAA